MPKTKWNNPDEMCQLIFLKIYPSNKDNDVKFLYIFTGNVKPCVQLPVVTETLTIPMNESPNE